MNSYSFLSLLLKVLSEYDSVPHSPNLPGLNFSCLAANYLDAIIMGDFLLFKTTHEGTHALKPEAAILALPVCNLGFCSLSSHI